jgi:hypothetical protein
MNNFTLGEREFIKLHYDINVNQLSLEESAEDLEIKDCDDPLTRKIKYCQELNKTTWKLSKLAYPVLALASNGETCVAKYILGKINPQKEQVVCSLDVLKVAPFGVYAGDSEFKEWFNNNNNTIDDVFKR